MTTQPKHLPRQLSVVSGSELWGDTLFHPHIRMAKIIEHSPMNGMDVGQTAAEIARRYNSHAALVEALENLLHEHKDLIQRIGKYEDGHKLLTGLADEVAPAEETLALAKGE